MRDRMTAKEIVYEILCTLDRIAIQLDRNDDPSKQMMTKDEFNESYDQMFMKLDQILSIVKRNDERRIADLKWLKQHDRTLEDHGG